MARDFGSVNVAIWSDPEWRKLPPAAQHLYLLLWTSPTLSYCGVHDWRPGRLAALSHGFNADHVGRVADCLVARHFLVVDHDTEEALIRSWARFDGLMKKPAWPSASSTPTPASRAEALRMSPRWVRDRIRLDGVEHQRYGHVICFTAEQVRKLRLAHRVGRSLGSVTTGPRKSWAG